MDPFAEPFDVQSIWRPLSDAETDSVAAWIIEASQQVRDEVPDVDGYDIDERIANGTLRQSTVRSVVARMVRRVMINPQGDASKTEQTGPFSVTSTKAKVNASGEMRITASEMGRLLGKRSRPQVAYMITPGSGPVFS